MADASRKPSLADWVAAQVRVTIFAADNDWPKTLDAWGGLDLGEAASYVKAKGEVIEQGPALDHWLVVQRSATRLDFFTVPNPEIEDAAFADIGPAKDAAERLVEFLKPWIAENCPDAARFAFGITARCPVETREEGYRKLSTLLPFTLEPENSSDFLYRINRARKSKAVRGIEINRLSEWSVAVLSTLSLEVARAAEGLTSTTRPRRSDHSCQVALDVNTKPGPDVRFPKTDTVKLLDECAALAQEIIEQGDIK